MCIRWYSDAWSDRKTEIYALKESMKEKAKKDCASISCKSKLIWFWIRGNEIEEERKEKS